MASAIFTPTWRSVCPALSQFGTLACTRSIASPAALSAATSAGVLRIRSGDTTSDASRSPAAGSALANWRTCSAHIRSLSATSSGRPTLPAMIANGSVSSPHGIMSTFSSQAGEAWAAFSSSPGTTRNGSSSAGTARQVSRSSCLASYPVT